MAWDLDHIGSYRLLKLVRAGANCQIWEAISELDNRRCALKVLQEEFRNDKEHVGLLRHEYTVGSQLDHENIIDIYDFNVSKNVPYLALEYFESSNLKQWLRDERDNDESNHQLPHIIRQCAAGLEHLHSHGWIHRDIKPDNFLLNDDYFVKLIDFAIAEKPKSGLAKWFSSRSKIQGTRSYMSPEQIRGDTPDPRSDIYSLGCMLFEMFCGRPPFTGASPDELLQKHMRAPVPSVAANSKLVSSEMADLIQRMIAKNPDHRPASMKQLLKDMENLRVLRRSS